MLGCAIPFNQDLLQIWTVRVKMVQNPVRV
jgi:hypothetical protein